MGVQKEKCTRVSGMVLKYTMKKVRRSKHARISVHQDGRVMVTAPYHVSFAEMERFFESKKEWIITTLGPAIVTKQQSPWGTLAHYRAHRERAKAFVRERLEYYNRYYHFSYAGVTIRNQKTRWGSCSAHGRLSFSYMLLFIEPRQADYIIVHELCHLKQMNHSPAFWDLVALTIPEYKEVRKSLKQRMIQ